MIPPYKYGMTQTNSSVLTIEGERLTLTGVDSVDSFSDNLIMLTVGGKRVRIEGAKLKVTAFSKGNGNFAANGEVSSVKFGGAKGRIGKLFK